VPYARQVSGIDIRGDAWSWWYAAAGRYERGSVPEPRAVMVMEATPTMPLGHVAVVESVTGAREITITQANWGNTPQTRGRIETGTPVLDVSPDNSWHAVRVWYRPAQAFGRVNPVYGFIYARPLVALGGSAAAGQLAMCLPTADLSGARTQ
jgi:surface antigen